MGDAGPSLEVGTPIRITRRIHVKNIVIQLCNCVIQYDGDLKTERYDSVQVVLLLSLSNIYQDVSYEGDLKYRDGDISESSSVSSCSKDDLSGRQAATFKIRKPNFVNFSFNKLKINKRKSACQSSETGDYIVMSCSLP